MAKDLEKILSENANLSDAMRKQISEAWNDRVEEAKAELREEFARKHEHDKQSLAEAMDKYVTDKLSIELEELTEDKKLLAKERVKLQDSLKEHTDLLDKFVIEKLTSEVTELRSDRVKMNEGLKKAENFILSKLSEEISELRNDRQALVEQRIKLIKEGKKRLHEAKQKFIDKAAKVVESRVEMGLKTEMSQLKEDIMEARKNEFGRQLFESFVGEYMNSHLNESSEIGKVMKQLKAKEDEMTQLKESIQEMEKGTKLMESKLNAANDRLKRDRKMASLLTNLARDKRAVMKDLLESVQTKDLDTAFNKYLPAVLNESAPQVKASRETLAESRAVNGNRAKQAHNEDADDDLAKMLSLAGIKK